MKKSDPDIGDLVVCTVRSVKDFGVVCSLDEYNQKEGFIHISEVSSGWIKYIRDYVREGQRVVCKVLDANPSRGRFDLSLRRVNDHQKREKLKEWKNEQRAMKIIESLLSQENQRFNIAEISDILEEKFSSLAYALDVAATDPAQFLDTLEGKEWAALIANYAKENLKPPVAKVTGIIELQCSAGNGIEIIRKSLAVANSEGIEITYAGAPKYRITALAEDLKTAEENMNKAGEAIIGYIKKHGGSGEGPVRI
jgi:translation initiation factor 2 subunit 1